MSDTPTEDRPYVWLDVGHANFPLPDGTLVQHGQVAVDRDTGVLIDPQPQYPDEPEVVEPKDEPAPTKVTSTTTKSSSSS
jgi:hypothetical protein